ncbi:MAG: hypothetical protein KF730_13240 [Sphingomonas sp.]|uniref:hypothetical protein n=1 Tax=Sphingomonas sp. TaxID=28214 RepID=UPI0025D11CEF|nr:hypothetical protein [Sphingomonas sp.]MBX3565527.1 hypothetical protein [Sphingomonas sp.]
MFITLLLAAADPLPATAADAEIAFARAAQTEGQWTAFRSFALPGATMFGDGPQPIEEAIKGLKDPPVAIQWWASDSFVSCDGALAVNTGPWLNRRGNNGYFTTVWERQPKGGWKWRVDGGDGVATPRAARDKAAIHRAACKGKPGTVSAATANDGKTGEGASADGTLAWRWHVAPDGARTFDAWLWDGRTMRSVIADRIAAPPPR